MQSSLKYGAKKDVQPNMTSEYLFPVVIPAFYFRKRVYYFPSKVGPLSVCLWICASICHVSCKCIYCLPIRRSNFKLCSCKGHMMNRVMGNISCYLITKVKFKGQIMYFIVNAPPPKPLNLTTLNFTSA